MSVPWCAEAHPAFQDTDSMLGDASGGGSGAAEAAAGNVDALTLLRDARALWGWGLDVSRPWRRAGGGVGAGASRLGAAAWGRLLAGLGYGEEELECFADTVHRILATSCMS